MPLISGTIPNLVNGVSQQPPSLRLKTQGALQENGFSTVVDGLRKRPASEHVAKILEVGDADDAFIHTIRRDENEFYILIITNGNLKVFDQLGVERSVTGDASYLSGITNPSTEITATSIADYTFVTNKNVVVQDNNTLSPVRPAEALFYVRQGDYLTDYSIKVTYDGTTKTFTYTTKDASAAANQSDVKTNNIATQLYNKIKNSTSGLPSSKFGWALYGSVIYVYRKDGGDFVATATDSRGETFLKAFKGQTGDFLDLPPKGKLGFTIKVVGDAKDQEDDYYVSLQDPEGNGQYVWREGLNGGLITGFDASTMPHQLVKQDDGTFVFQQSPWEDREAGDDLTNPLPSFVGNKINDIFLHRNRLGILSDENVIFSEVAEYYNFFAKTVLTLLDSNPIDVAVSNNQVSILRHAVPFSKSLLLFSDLTQFNLSAGEVLTPETVSIDVATQFEASLRSKPQGAGRFVFFATRRGKWSGVREYFVETGSDQNTNALEVTAHVPRYLEGEIVKLAASSNEETLLCITADDPNSIYVYRYYWSAQSKLQSAWSKWTFDGKVLNCEFNMSDIYIIIEREDGIFLEVINMSRDTAALDTDGSWSVHLDRRVRLATGGLSDIPYTDSKAIYVTDGGIVMDKNDAAFQTKLADYLAGGGVVFAGIPYNFRYIFSEIVIKEDNEPITIARLQIRKMGLVYYDTGYFEVEVRPKSRTPSKQLFTGRVVGSLNNTIGKVPVESGTLSIPVLTKSDLVEVEVSSDSHLPCQFQSVEWEGFYTLRSSRQ
jgi:hypothetical protein